MKSKILTVIENHPAPGWRDIKLETQFSKKIVQLNLSKLVKEGLIVRHTRLDDTRRTYYRLVMIK